MTSKHMIEIWEAQTLRRGKTKFKATPVDMSVVAGNLERMLADLLAVLEKLPPSPSGYAVDEIELSLGVSGKGTVGIITKVEVGVQAGIKVRIKRRTS